MKTIHAKHSEIEEAVVDNRIEDVKELVTTDGCKIGTRVLVYAVCNNRTEIFKYLLDNKLVKVPYEEDLMFLIVLSIDSDEHLNIIKYLVEKQNFDIHTQDDMLIRNAFRFNQNETIKYLVKVDSELRLLKFLSPLGTVAKPSPPGTVASRRDSAPQVFKYTIVNKILKNTVLSNDVIGHISTFL